MKVSVPRPRPRQDLLQARRASSRAIATQAAASIAPERRPHVAERQPASSSLTSHHDMMTVFPPKVTSVRG